VRIGVSVEAKEIDLRLCVPIDMRFIPIKGEAWTIAVLVGIEQDVVAVIFIVAVKK
jgi:hypothetical protein